MNLIGILLFILTGVCALMTVAARYSEVRMRRAKVIKAKVVNCQKVEGKQAVFGGYTIKYIFNVNGKEQTFSQDEQNEKAIDSEEKMLLLGNDVDTFLLCDLKEKYRNKSLPMLLLTIVVFSTALIITKFKTFSLFLDYLLNLETQSVNFIIAILIFIVSILLFSHSFKRICEFNHIKRLVLKNCNEDMTFEEKLKKRKKVSIIEQYKGEKSQRYIFKTKASSDYYNEEIIDFFENDSEIGDVIIEDKIDKTQCFFGILTSIIMLLSSVLIFLM